MAWKNRRNVFHGVENGAEGGRRGRDQGSSGGRGVSGSGVERIRST